jgi:hypothetical protein
MAADVGRYEHVVRMAVGYQLSAIGETLSPIADS